MHLAKTRLLSHFHKQEIRTFMGCFNMMRAKCSKSWYWGEFNQVFTHDMLLEHTHRKNFDAPTFPVPFYFVPKEKD